ncbi:MAG: hypothetical protein ACI9MR_004245 [Myxococcota bacterium]
MFIDSSREGERMRRIGVVFVILPLLWAAPGCGESDDDGSPGGEDTPAEDTAGEGTTDGERTEPCTPNPCQNEGVCSPSGGANGAVCNCAGTGFEGDACSEDIDECAGPGTRCSDEAACTNIPGSFECVCNAGYSGDGLDCTEVDECATNNGGCDPSAACINLPGSFLCKCPLGTAGNGLVCGPDPATLTYNGLTGYISSSSAPTPGLYRYGASFYSSAWRLTPEPLKNFQIGLPGTWFTPDNSDNTTTAMCPVGTVAGDNWPERGPTYSSVFQTMEGGLGYWANNQYRYGPPKFSMNATPDCYNSQIASPGWAFFNGASPLPDETLGIAQLSNRMLVPPDGLPFQGDPHGELIGYGFIALPLTDPRPDPQPTGAQSWTLFLNSTNFRGPLAYYLPETWSKISKNYPFDEGRGLDSRPIKDRLGGSMEINTVQQFQSMGDDGVLYTKIPQLQFPVDDQGKTTLVRDLSFYSKGALYDDVLAWRAGGSAPSGRIAEEHTFKPSLSTSPVTYRQSEQQISGINALATPTVFEDNVFGLQWTNAGEAGMAKFPRYFKQQGDQRVAISEDAVPSETHLKFKEFPTGTAPGHTYSAAPLVGPWSTPGPVEGPHQVELGDCSMVTYHWYKFIDQPVFQQYAWTSQEKTALQSIVEKAHQHWTPDKAYLPAPTGGALGGFDTGLMVTPPAGYEVGYVPIVTRQEPSLAVGCPSQVQAEQIAAQEAVLKTLTAADLVGVYKRVPVENGWHEVTVFVDAEGQLWWKNLAAQWTLFLAQGRLTTGADCPYGVLDVEVELLSDPEGAVYRFPDKLRFTGDSYERVWDSTP